MSLSITPGYDFAADEVPTRAKLRLAAGNIQVTDLDWTDVGATVRLMLNGQASEGSGASMAAEGWMYYDARGNTWIRQRWTITDFGMSGVTEGYSDTPLFRVLGGWATTRAPFLGANRAAGQPVHAYTSGLAGDSRYSPAVLNWRSGWSQQHVEGANDLGFLQETTATGARAPVVGRGAAKHWLGLVAADRDPTARMTSTSGVQWAVYPLNHSASGYKRWLLEHNGWMPEAGYLGNHRIDWPIAWAYGKPIYGDSSAL